MTAPSGGRRSNGRKRLINRCSRSMHEKRPRRNQNAIKLISECDKKRCTAELAPYITVGHTIEILGTGASDLSLGSTLDAKQGPPGLP
jgi:hypothetical protein